MSRPRTSMSTAIGCLAADLALVLVFVLIGRASHDENPIVGVLTTFWPFAVGVLVGWLLGWLLGGVWRSPSTVLWSGLIVWVSTVAIGMLLRAISGQGVQFSFVIVTIIVLAVFLLGWRGVATLVLRRRTTRSRPVRSRP